MLPPRLERDLDRLRPTWAVEVVEEDGVINVIFPDFPTAPGFSHERTTLLIRVPRAYPDAGLDMFWTDPGLTLAGGGIPRNAEPIESYAGRSWRRFSWHPARWLPQSDDLESYLEFVRRRFRDA